MTLNCSPYVLSASLHIWSLYYMHTGQFSPLLMFLFPSPSYVSAFWSYIVSSVTMFYEVAQKRTNSHLEFFPCDSVITTAGEPCVEEACC